ncbi:DUF4097 domain-containing protein [Pseudonocardia benzenivorans]|uniref:DUF4097 domain-containing protein n=2 Tax=Pseudonocardia TaxID=1847 RepID=F4D116_PSEUX|nr:DUF4097 family beta strand repeat-containing protein [Pseudonocardia dioxanivorans]AEA26804.1 hypothetical protein Psed_4656 [Pseudonocardia dioxanivorans CB1190]GJF01052.1 hypothetical protein PSD17_00160 [Pseudonocardia sp. D17]
MTDDTRDDDRHPDDRPGESRTGAADETGHELTRQERWDASGPAELELNIDVGSVRVELSDTREVWVEVRHEAQGGNVWTNGIAGLFNWLGSAAGRGGFGNVQGLGDVQGFPSAGFGGFDPGQITEELAARAVEAAEIRWSEASRRLVVRSSQEMPLRMVPLAVTVRAPVSSRHAVRTGAGEVTVTGRAGWGAVRTGSGEVRLEETTGDVDVTTGSGDVDLGVVGGRGKIRTGSGRIAVAALSGPSEVKSGSGDVELGEVTGDLGVRTGSGEVRIADAVSGTFELTTGSGGIRIGVHSGVAAELDLSSGTGRARSELEVTGVAPQSAPALRIRGRAGTGDVVVSRAAAATV